MTQSPTRQLFLLAGQSNMAGYGDPGAVPALTHPHVEVWREGRYEPAREPLHDEPLAGVGLAMAFACTVAADDPSARLGLLPCAVGGTSIQRWRPGGDLYVRAVEHTRAAAAAGGVLRGILWHQGEADSDARRHAGAYYDHLAHVVAGFRHDLGDVPVVVGELGRFLDAYPGCGYHGLVDAALHRAADELPRVACASAEGLTDQGDALHFDAPSLRVLGARYAAAYLALVHDDDRLHPSSAHR